MLILFPWKPVVLACGLLSGLLLLGFIGSSLMEGKNPFSPDLSHTRLYATPDHAFRSVFESGTNVGAGYSCHPTGSDHLRSTRVPLHPVWPWTANCTLSGTNLGLPKTIPAGSLGHRSIAQMTISASGSCFRAAARRRDQNAVLLSAVTVGVQFRLTALQNITRPVHKRRDELTAGLIRLDVPGHLFITQLHARNVARQ
jgi:hypothetical protein